MTTERPEAAPLHRQVQYLDEALKQNAVAQAALAVSVDPVLPGWHLGAGGGRADRLEPPARIRSRLKGSRTSILVYFGPADLSVDAESEIEEEVACELKVSLSHRTRAWPLSLGSRVATPRQVPVKKSKAIT